MKPLWPFVELLILTGPERIRVSNGLTLLFNKKYTFIDTGASPSIVEDRRKLEDYQACNILAGQISFAITARKNLLEIQERLDEEELIRRKKIEELNNG